MFSKLFNLLAWGGGWKFLFGDAEEYAKNIK